jgi:hypothetical protein
MSAAEEVNSLVVSTLTAAETGSSSNVQVCWKGWEHKHTVLERFGRCRAVSAWPSGVMTDCCWKG